MKPMISRLAVGIALCCATAGSAFGYIIAQEVEQPFAADQQSFEVVLDGNGRIIRTSELVGGYSEATNSFANPARHDTDNRDAGGLDTIVRFISGDGASIATSTDGGSHFALAGWGGPPATLNRYWMPEGTANGAVPSASVRFDRTGSDVVTVTLFNATSSSTTFSVSSVGYRVLGRDSFSINDLNATTMPGSGFNSAGVADDTEIAPGGEVSFTVSGVGLDDDVVVYFRAAFSGASANQPFAGSIANWVAMDSGAPAALRGPWFGRINTIGLHDSNLSVETVPGLGIADMRSKTPFKTVTAVVGPPTRFVPFQVDQDATTELLINTSGPGGMKLSYLRTDSGDVYDDVSVSARFEIGGSIGTTTPVPADDFGGPIAVRIQPGGGSYYLSIVTGRPNQIDLMRDATDGSTQSSLASASQWDNGDAIALDFNLAAPTAFQATLTAQGTTISATVVERGNPGHSLTLTAEDATYARGYVGLRSQRDGSGIMFDPQGPRFDTPTNDLASAESETVVDLFSIEDPNFVPTLGRAIFLTDSEARVDHPGFGFSGNDERTGENLADHAVAALLREVGFDVAEVDSDTEWTSSPFTLPQVNAEFDLMWVSGGSGSGATRDLVPCLTMPFIFSEHVDARAEWTGMAPGTGPDLRRGALGQGREFFRLAPAVDGGSPDHPILVGLPIDGTGDQEGTNLLQFYDEPQAHMQNIQPSVGDNLAYHVVPEGDPDSLTTERRNDGSIHVAVAVVDVGVARAGPAGSIADCVRTPDFPARHAFFGVGDGQFHRLAVQGRELARRTVLWLAGQDVVAEAPQFVSIMDGLGASPDAFISPLGENVGLTRFALTTDIPLTTINVVGSAYTAGGAAPTVASFESAGDGSHVVTLDSAVAPGNWLRLDLEVTGAGTAPATFSVWLAHQPLDVNQDGMTSIRDATAFGDEFRGRSDPRLVDINGDGTVNVRDATAFGDNWNGVAPLQTWRNTQLPAQP